jgi:hypothetical protein
MKIPDFFIVGAPKCGTTSMCQYLDLHPKIFISKPKEPNYFCYEVIGRNPRSRNLQDYLNLFQSDSDKVCGEGSPWNLYSKTAAKEIYDLNPHAKIIIMLRNPVDFLHSLHSHHVVYSHENIFDFASALEAENERRSGKKIPNTCHVPAQLLYSEIAEFSTQVKRYFDTFGRKQVHVIIFDDFKNHTAKIYKETLEFIGVDSLFTPDLKIHNSNKKISNPYFYHFFNKPPQWIFELVNNITPSFLYPVKKQIGSGIRKSFRKILTKNQSRSSIDYELRNHLKQTYSPEVNKLSLLLDRDLSFWLANELALNINS